VLLQESRLLLIMTMAVIASVPMGTSCAQNGAETWEMRCVCVCVCAFFNASSDLLSAICNSENCPYVKFQCFEMGWSLSSAI